MRRMRARLRTFAVLAVMVLTACSQGVSDKSLRYVSADEAVALAAGQDTLLGIGGRAAGAYIDPRPAASYDVEHIPGAIRLPFDRVREAQQNLHDYGVLIVYGDDYNDSLALAMSKRLIELGYKEVHTLRGGLRAWKAAGNPVESGPS